MPIENTPPILFNKNLEIKKQEVQYFKNIFLIKQQQGKTSPLGGKAGNTQIPAFMAGSRLKKDLNLAFF